MAGFHKKKKKKKKRGARLSGRGGEREIERARVMGGGERGETP